jgi:hypothetical protein
LPNESQQSFFTEHFSVLVCAFVRPSEYTTRMSPLSRLKALGGLEGKRPFAQ